jgi:hypothetical protein
MNYKIFYVYVQVSDGEVSGSMWIRCKQVWAYGENFSVLNIYVPSSEAYYSTAHIRPSSEKFLAI